jgi:vancomycin resistance protein YoaR
MKKFTPWTIGTVIAISIILLVMATYEIAYWDKIYPGTKVAGIKVGNSNIQEANQILQQKLASSREIRLVGGTNEWRFPLASWGVAYDYSDTALSAYASGRNASPWKNLQAKALAWRGGVDINPKFDFEENLTLESIASISAAINIPASEPQVTILDGQVQVSLGENGQSIDEQALLAQIRKAVVNPGITRIELPIKKLEPKLTSQQADLVRVRAEQAVGKKIILTAGSESWEISDTQIVSWINPSSSSEWKISTIASWINDLAETIDRPADNAHFSYLGSGKVEEFKPAVVGRAIDKVKLTTELQNTLSKQSASSNQAITLEIPLVTVQPELSTADVNTMGITELIGRGESDYTGSIPNRIFNLQKAADFMHGVLIAPGEEFSFNKYVGDISAAGGYKQAYIIKDGRTILGDGGGVCQVSTTMFRAAMASGLPITERHAHAYRVHYYENDRQPGYDATIFTPSVDFKFKNDTPGYILIQTKLDEVHKRLAFEFYGTSDGRIVDISKARVWDVTSPPPALYQDDPTLAVGVVKQVDFPSWGSKAAFDYKVTRNGEILQQQTFYSNYRPWQAVFLKGTKTN